MQTTLGWMAIGHSGRMPVACQAISAATNYTSSATATSQSITLSTNSSGDRLVILAASRNQTTIMGAPSGWTLIGSIVSTSGTGGTTEIYSKISNGAEGASITHTWTGARGAGFRCLTYNGGTEFDSEVQQFKEDVSAVNTITMPSITADRAGALIVAVSRSQSGATFTSTVTNERFDNSSGTPNVSLAGYDESVSTGATGTRTFTASGTASTRLSAVAVVLLETASSAVSATGAIALGGLSLSGAQSLATDSTGAIALASLGSSATSTAATSSTGAIALTELTSAATGAAIATSDGAIALTSADLAANGQSSTDTTSGTTTGQLSADSVLSTTTNADGAIANAALNIDGAIGASTTIDGAIATDSLILSATQSASIDSNGAIATGQVDLSADVLIGSFVLVSAHIDLGEVGVSADGAIATIAEFASELGGLQSAVASAVDAGVSGAIVLLPLNMLASLGSAIDAASAVIVSPVVLSAAIAATVPVDLSANISLAGLLIDGSIAIAAEATRIKSVVVQRRQISASVVPRLVVGAIARQQVSITKVERN